MTLEGTRLEALLQAAETRADASAARLLDAVQNTGRARHDVLLMQQEVDWLRGMVTEANAAEAQSRAENAWLRSQADERTAKLLAHVQESAWLRGCLAESDARLTVETHRRAEAEQRAASAGHARQLLTQRVLERLPAPLRKARRLLLRAPAPPPQAPAAKALQAPSPPVAAPAPPVSRPSPATPIVPVPPAAPARGIAPSVTPPAPSRRTGQAPVATVHQFHAGSASGDAITNSMLLIRTLLRAAGFRSEIFVESRGPGLEGDIQLMESLPEHADYVLLVHHSMGFPSFDRILALPAAKVLVYHNITPAQFLADIPRIQAGAELGRKQLAALRDHVAFALADSDFNAVDLHALGFPAVRTCPLLFDVATLARRAAGPRPGDGVFTVLFVGRLTPSKGQDELVQAFAAFRTKFGRPCRLVLVGALDPDEYLYLERLTATIAAAGLQDDVKITGLVSDAELHAYYRQADLYVSLSRHEGFGVPLVEAMAHGIPVAAWPTGAVPYTTGGAAALLTSRSAEDVAAVMLDLAGRRDEAGAAGPVAIQRFALQQHAPVLMAALAAAGAVPPCDPASHECIAANLRVAISGHFAKSYSLAAVNRGLARTLEVQRPGTVRVMPVEGQPTRELGEVPEGERAGIAGLAARPKPDTGPELVVSGHYPVHVPAECGDLLAALFFWEESLVPAATVAVLNQEFGAVLAPSRAVAKALVDSGVSRPVLNLGQAPDLSAFVALPRRCRQGAFTFLHVSSAFPRKGVDVLLAAWRQAFALADDVRLIIKAFPNPHNDAAGQLARFRRDHPGAAPVELVDADLDGDALLALYRQADAAVLPSRGEGYNLPAAEAMAAGLPVIVTDHGGHLDFCTHDTARLVKRSLVRAGSHLSAPFSLWAEPDVTDLSAALREAASGALDRLTGPALHAITAAADPARFTARLTRAAATLILAQPASPIRLAWVSSWDVRCGVAEYSRTLLEAMPRDGMAESVVLTDDRTAAQAGSRPVWRIGGPDSAGRLATAIAQVDPDIVLVQHQPALLPWLGLAELVDALAESGRAAVVTLHNTRHLLEIAPQDRLATVAALARAARILVHTVADVALLDGLGLAGLTTLLPHPAPAPRPAVTRDLPLDAVPVIGCTGFFLPGKGIPALISATARLRRRWPDIRLRLVNAEYDDPLSAAEIAACRRQAAAEGVAVEWHTSFVSQQEQQRLFTGCDLLVLPYQHSLESSSAALRTALGSGIPVAVTPLPLFDEAAGVVFTLPGCDPAAMELGIAHLLANADRRSALAAGAAAWLADRAAPDVARRLHGMLCGLAVQQRMGVPLDGSVSGFCNS